MANSTLHSPEEDAFVNSIIGEGTTLRGDFELNGLLRIDGTFYGSVKTNGKVLIGKNGVAECDIVAGTVVIGGKVKGEIIATERIILLSTGELIGNIKTLRLIIEEGVLFDGTCEIIEDKERLQKVKDDFLERFGVSADDTLKKSAQEDSPKEKGKSIQDSSLKAETSHPLSFKEETKVT